MSEYDGTHDGRRILIDLTVVAPDGGVGFAVQAQALVDTGATTSGVSADIARHLSLPLLAKRPISTAAGLIQSERLLFRLGLPQNGTSAPYVFDEVLGFLLNDGMSCEVLIGMDVLSQCDFTVHRDRSWTLRYP